MLTREDIQNAIARAKQDWESTADTLPHVVCLLDDQRCAVRVNRVIESWQLGRVNEVLGRDMHELLHPLAIGFRYYSSAAIFERRQDNQRARECAHETKQEY